MNRRLCSTLLLFSSLLGATGCRRNPRHVVAAPPLAPDVTPQMVSVPPPTHPSEPLPPKPVVPTATVTQSGELPRKTRKMRKPVAAASVPAPAALPAPPPAANPAQTAAAPPTSANPLGQLSTGGDSSGQGVQQSADLVHAQEARFTALSVTLQNQYKTEVEQVKRFLTQAEDALKTSDTEGARTLAVKAKVLLDEIQK